MNENRIKLEVVTPEGAVFSDMVEELSGPGALGSLGILFNHAPLMTTMENGVLKYTQEGKKRKLAISGGFLEVKKNQILILAHTAELGEEIDRERAQRSLERAKERLAEKAAGLDVARAEAAMKRALSRLEAAKQ
ncbi:MAG: F0F1 ATP synthase subunit epsilon [Clostridiales bacterium]|nr:F0F1 ATP synthase subunit epsilon [Clostridiales bacterium]